MGELTISSPFSTPVSTFGTFLWASSLTLSTWSSRRICKVCLVDNFRCLKRADAATADRVIWATFCEEKKVKIASFNSSSHATWDTATLLMDFVIFWSQNRWKCCRADEVTLGRTFGTSKQVQACLGLIPQPEGAKLRVWRISAEDGA